MVAEAACTLGDRQEPCNISITCHSTGWPAPTWQLVAVTTSGHPMLALGQMGSTSVGEAVLNGDTFWCHNSRMLCLGHRWGQHSLRVVIRVRCSKNSVSSHLCRYYYYISKSSHCWHFLLFLPLPKEWHTCIYPDSVSLLLDWHPQGILQYCHPRDITSDSWAPGYKKQKPVESRP
jgi:hypothetical protein